MAAQSEDVDLGLTSSEEETDPRDVTPDGRPKRARPFPRSSGSIHSCTSKHSNATSRASTRSESSSTESNNSAKISALVTAATLVARLKGQRVANEMKLEMEATEAEEERKNRERQQEMRATEAEERRKKIERQQEMEATEAEEGRKKKERQREIEATEAEEGRTKRERQREIEAMEEEETRKKIERQLEIEYTEAEQARKKKQRQRQLDALELRTQIAEQKAIIDVLEMYEESSNLPLLPHLNLVEYPPSKLLAPIKSASIAVSHESARQNVDFMANLFPHAGPDQQTTAATMSTVPESTAAVPSAGLSLSADQLTVSSAVRDVVFAALEDGPHTEQTASSIVTTSRPRNVDEPSAKPLMDSATFVTTAGAIHGSSAAVHTTASAGQPVMSTRPFWSADERRPTDDPSTHPSSPRVDLLTPPQSGLGVATGADHFGIFDHQPFHENVYPPRFPSLSHAYTLDPRLSERTNEQNETERHGTEQNGKERNGTERNETERNGTNDTERNDTEQNRMERNRMERNRMEQNETEQNRRNEQNKPTNRTYERTNALDPRLKPLAYPFTQGVSGHFQHVSPEQEPCIFFGDLLLYPIWMPSFPFLIGRQNSYGRFEPLVAF